MAVYQANGYSSLYTGCKDYICCIKLQSLIPKACQEICLKINQIVCLYEIIGSFDIKYKKVTKNTVY